MSILLALAMTLAAQDNGTGGPGLRWQTIDRTPGFPGWRRLLQRHVDDQAKRHVNHLCGIVGIDPVDGRPDLVTAYFYWPEQHLIELLSNTDDATMSEMLFGRGPINLHTDIIDPNEPVNLNPNAVTRGWVDRLIARCHESGTRLTIIKRGRP